MKWITHQAAAAGAALALHLSPAGVAAACVGAALPDALDQLLAGLAPTPRGRQKAFNRIHRGATHWFGWWLALFLAALVSRLPQPGLAVLTGLGFGGLSHVVLDMLTPQGVPLQPLSRKRRFSLGLCATGSVGEYCFLAAIVLAVWFFMGRDPQHLVLRLGQCVLF